MTWSYPVHFRKKWIRDKNGNWLNLNFIDMIATYQKHVIATFQDENLYNGHTLSIHDNEEEAQEALDKLMQDII